MQVVDLVDSDTSGQQQPMCAPLVTNSPPGRSSKSGKSPIIATTADVAIRRESVIVYYGIQELKVPLQFCRLFTVPDDQALEILHGSAYDTEKALAVVAQLLAVDKTTATTSTMGVPLEIVDSAARRKAGRPPLAQTVTTSEADAAINRCLISPTELDHLHGIVERWDSFLFPPPIIYAVLILFIVKYLIIF